MRWHKPIQFERVAVYFESGDYIVHNVDLNSWVVFTPEEYKIAARMIYENDTPERLLKCWPKPEVHSVFGKLLLYKIGYQGNRPEEYDIVEAARIGPISTGAPESVYFVTSNKCNLNCVYCYAESSPWRSIKGDLSNAEAIDMIDQIRDLQTKTMVFTGGEALLRKDVFCLMEHAKSLGLRVNLVTNGLLISERNIGCLQEICNMVTISLDSLDKDEHEANRGKGSWHRVMKAIQLVHQAGIRLKINQTITKHNPNAFEEMSEFAKENDYRVNVVPLANLGRGDENSQGLNAVQLRKLSDLMIDAEIEGVQDAGCQSVQIKQFSHNMQCGHGTGEFSIDGKGNVFPCKLMHNPLFQAGSIREAPLKEIWENSDVFKEARKRTAYSLPDCEACNFRESCGGGCRAFHWGATGNPYGTSHSACSDIRRTTRKRMWASFRLKDQGVNQDEIGTPMDA